MSKKKTRKGKSDLKQSKSNSVRIESGFFDQKYFKYLVPAFIFVLSWIIYSNTFDSPFQFDDTLQIVKKDKVNSMSDYDSFSEWIDVNKRPLAFFTFALNFYFGGYNVQGYHWVNLIIHVLNSWLVFLIVLQLFRSRVLHEHLLFKQRKVLALAAALIFAVHPIQTMGVTYIIQRMTSLSTLFYLLTLFLYVKGRFEQITENFPKALLYFALAGLSALASLISKQIAVTLPFVILLYEFFFIRDNQNKIYKKHLIVGAGAMLLLIVVVLLGGFLPEETAEISRHDYLLTQLRVIIKYFQLLILPFSQNVDYDFSISTSFLSLPVILSFIVLLGLFVLAFYFRRKLPLISFGILWIFITLSVESSIIPISDVIFEHRLYLPMFGFALILVSTVFQFLQKPARLPVIVMILIVAAYSAATYSRNQVWESEFSLWKDVSEKSPEKMRPWYNLGKISLDDGRYSESVQYLKKCLEVDPEHVDAWYNLGYALEKQGRAEEAVKYYNKVLEIDSLNQRALINLSSYYNIQKNYKKSIELLEKLKGKDGNQVPVLNNLGIAYYYQGEYEKAIKVNKRQLKLQPSNAQLHSRIGKALMQLDKHSQAVSYFEKALEINPKMTNALVDKGSCYYTLGQFDKALEDYQRARELNPKTPNINRYIGMSKASLNKKVRTN